LLACCVAARLDNPPGVAYAPAMIATDAIAKRVWTEADLMGETIQL